MRLQDLFERTYVVNLPERRDRRRAITEELDRFAMPLSPGKVELFPAIRPAEAEGFPSVGTLGCFLSHLEVMRRARDMRLRSVLVLEDDLSLSKRLHAVESDLVEELKRRDWDFVHLAYYPYHGRTYADYGGVEGQDAPSNAVLRRHREPPVLGTHFYGVEGSVVGRLVTFLERLLQARRKAPPPRLGDDPVVLDGACMDAALHLFRMANPDVVTLVACPSLGEQRSSKSDVTTGSLDQVRWLSPLLGLVRPVKTRLRRIFE